MIATLTSVQLVPAYWYADLLPIGDIRQLGALHLDTADYACLTVLALMAAMVRESMAPRWVHTRKARSGSYRTNLCTLLGQEAVFSILPLSALFEVGQAYARQGLLAPLPAGWMKWILGFLLFDLMLYGWHAASHRWAWLWTFHKVHHSDPMLNVTTGLRFHVGELLITALAKALFMAVAGISLPCMLAYEALVRLFVLFHHTDTHVPGERRLSRVIVVPEFHRMHHSSLRAEHDSNYGLVFSVWDRIFRTCRIGLPERIGLPGVPGQNCLQLLRFGFVRVSAASKLAHPAIEIDPLLPSPASAVDVADVNPPRRARPANALPSACLILMHAWSHGAAYNLLHIAQHNLRFWHRCNQRQLAFWVRYQSLDR